MIHVVTLKRAVWHTEKNWKCVLASVGTYFRNIRNINGSVLEQAVQNRRDAIIRLSYRRLLLFPCRVWPSRMSDALSKFVDSFSTHNYFSSGQLSLAHLNCESVYCHGNCSPYQMNAYY